MVTICLINALTTKAFLLVKYLFYYEFKFSNKVTKLFLSLNASKLQLFPAAGLNRRVLRLA